MNSVWHYYCYLLRRHLISWRMFAVLTATVLAMDFFIVPIRTYCRAMDVKMSQWGFALIWNSKYVVLCFILIFIFAAAIFPEDRAKDRYIIARIGTSKWAFAQAMYVVTFGWIYMFILYASLNVLLLNIMEFIPDWGLGWGTFTNADIILKYDLYITVSNLVVSNFDPLYANILVAVIMGLFLGMMGMLMFWLNCYSKIVGPIVTSAVLLLDMAVKRGVKILKYSPASWLRLNMHYSINKADQPTLTYVIGMLILLTLLFFALAKTTIDQTQENGRKRR